jgi:glycosyltransferase involved in cell wall biosynthesis
MKKKISILITTKNRIEDLKITLTNLVGLIDDSAVECMVYDDGSTDGTSQFIQENYPNISFFKNEVSKGYMYNRNFLLNHCSGDYAVSLDDDAHFLSENVVENIERYFESQPKCGVIACRIFWGKKHQLHLTKK